MMHQTASDPIRSNPISSEQNSSDHVVSWASFTQLCTLALSSPGLSSANVVCAEKKSSSCEFSLCQLYTRIVLFCVHAHTIHLWLVRGWYLHTHTHTQQWSRERYRQTTITVRFCAVTMVVVEVAILHFLFLMIVQPPMYISHQTQSSSTVTFDGHQNDDDDELTTSLLHWINFQAFALARFAISCCC